MIWREYRGAGWCGAVERAGKGGSEGASAWYEELFATED